MNWKPNHDQRLADITAIEPNEVVTHSPAPSNLTVRWMDVHVQRRYLAGVLAEWDADKKSSGRGPNGSRPAETSPSSRLAATFQQAALHAIIHDAWSAEHRLQPSHSVAVLNFLPGPKGVLGVLSATANSGLGAVCINEIAIHPMVPMNSSDWGVCAGLLVDCAIEASVDSGLHGWVAVQPTPEQDDGRIWASLGFVRYDDLTYRRMGHYTIRPIHPAANLTIFSSEQRIEDSDSARHHVSDAESI